MWLRVMLGWRRGDNDVNNMEEAMKMEFDGAKASFNLLDLVDNLSTEQKRELAQCLVWDKELMDEFVDKLMTDPVVTSSFNSITYDARLKLVELLPVMAQEIIRSLLWELKGAQSEEHRYRKWAWELYHAWPNSEVRRPKPETFIPTPLPSTNEVRAMWGAYNANT